MVVDIEIVSLLEEIRVFSCSSLFLYHRYNFYTTDTKYTGTLFFNALINTTSSCIFITLFT